MFFSNRNLRNTAVCLFSNSFYFLISYFIALTPLYLWSTRHNSQENIIFFSNTNIFIGVVVMLKNAHKNYKVLVFFLHVLHFNKKICVHKKICENIRKILEIKNKIRLINQWHYWSIRFCFARKFDIVFLLIQLS